MSLQSKPAALKNLLHNRSEMFHLIHQFNVHPAGYAHPTWLEAVAPPALCDRLVKTRRGVSRLSKLLLQHHGLHRSTCYDFEHRWWRLALLPAKVLAQLTFFCGLAALHRQIAVIVDKQTLAQVKACLNQTDYLFAVKRSPLFIGQNHGLALDWDGSSDIGGLARQYGTAYFLSHFHDAPTAVTARLAFKFPRSLPHMRVRRPAGTNGWQLFKRILIHEIAPRWQTLFS